MNQQQLLDREVGRLFADLMAPGMPATDSPQSLGQLWEHIVHLGLPDLFLPEEAGGFNGSWRDAGVVFTHSGRHAVPAPIGETILAHRWLQRAGQETPEGPISIGACPQAQLATAASGCCFTGRVDLVPWGAQVAWLLVACADGWALLPTAAAAKLESRTNTAGEPRATLHFCAATVAQHWHAADAVPTLAAAGALLRAGQMAGALETALRLAVTHVKERRQFGRPIGQFQALQQQLAVLAEETAAAGCAAQAACHAADHSDSVFQIAAAKLRANRAAAQATAIAHQVHGAIGFTREHTLHRFTLRLLAWRAEFGNDRHWAEYLGRRVAGAGPLWHQLTALDIAAEAVA